MRGGRVRREEERENEREREGGMWELDGERCVRGWGREYISTHQKEWIIYRSAKSHPNSTTITSEISFSGFESASSSCLLRNVTRP